MAELRFIITVDDHRNLPLPDGVPFEIGEPLHILWDGNVLQVSRRKPKSLSDAYAKVQKDAGRVLETDQLARRLAEAEEIRRLKLAELFGGGTKAE
jgi:hypothetical protein